MFAIIHWLKSNVPHQTQMLHQCTGHLHVPFLCYWCFWLIFYTHCLSNVHTSYSTSVTLLEKSNVSHNAHIYYSILLKTNASNSPMHPMWCFVRTNSRNLQCVVVVHVQNSGCIMGLTLNYPLTLLTVNDSPAKASYNVHGTQGWGKNILFGGYSHEQGSMVSAVQPLFFHYPTVLLS